MKGDLIMYETQQYGSVITEQGDLGLGVTPICENETEENKREKKDKE